MAVYIQLINPIGLGETMDKELFLIASFAWLEHSSWSSLGTPVCPVLRSKTSNEEMNDIAVLNCPQKMLAIQAR